MVPSDPQQWTAQDSQYISNIVEHAAQRHVGKIQNCLDKCEDDLIQESLRRIVKAWPKFNRAKWTPQSYIEPIVRGVSVDWYRTQESRNRLLKIAAEARPDLKLLHESSLSEFMATIKDRVMQRFDRPRKHREHGMRLWQLVMLALSQAAMGCSSRGLAAMLANEPDALALLGLKVVPSDRTLQRRLAEPPKRDRVARRIATMLK